MGTIKATMVKQLCRNCGHSFTVLFSEYKRTHVRLCPECQITPPERPDLDAR